MLTEHMFVSRRDSPKCEMQIADIKIKREQGQELRIIQENRNCKETAASSEKAAIGIFVAYHKERRFREFNAHRMQ